MKGRLQKIISSYGIASRRAAEELIKAGKVSVNGRAAMLGECADDETDEITVNGKPLTKVPQKVYLMLNKPREYVTTLSDEKGRKTVRELISGCKERVYPVGRLDMYSEGLLIFTNDGSVAERMMHPKYGLEKEYLVTVSGDIKGNSDKLCESIEIDGKMTTPADIKIISESADTAMISVTVREGRNRQVRRLCEHANLKVTRLIRVREGELLLGSLKCGKWRYLNDSEVEYLKKECGL